MNDWYTVINPGSSVCQGEIIFKCPVLFPDPEIDYTTLTNPAEVHFTKKLKDVIVMTQGCDLQKAKQDYGVVLCPILDLKSVPKEGFLGNLKSNRIEHLHLLNKSSVHNVDFWIVDFSIKYIVPFAVLNSWVKGVQEERIGLTSPFLELISQRFGNYYARIGIEDDDQPKMDDLISRWKDLRSQSV